MKKQLFQKWEPIADLPGKLYLVALHDDNEGFRILLREDGSGGKALKISFETRLAYRNVDEGDLILTLHNSDGIFAWSLYTVVNSSYVQWFRDESQNIHERTDIVHYAIYTPDDCIDVLAVDSPLVEWLQEGIN